MQRTLSRERNGERRRALVPKTLGI